MSLWSIYETSSNIYVYEANKRYVTFMINWTLMLYIIYISKLWELFIYWNYLHQFQCHRNQRRNKGSSIDLYTYYRNSCCHLLASQPLRLSQWHFWQNLFSMSHLIKEAKLKLGGQGPDPDKLEEASPNESDKRNGFLVPWWFTKDQWHNL